MVPKIDMKLLHPNRVKIQRADYSNQDFDFYLTNPDINALYEREENLQELPDIWTDAGSAIFAFRDDLQRMFIHTDVMDLPINQIHLPYETIYCYLDDTDLIPLGNYRIDGFYVHTLYSIEYMASNQSEEQIRKIVLSDLGIAEEAVKDPNTPKEIREMWQRDLDLGYEGLVAQRLKSQERDNKIYQEYLQDPDAFYADDNHDDHLILSITFTVIQKNQIIRPLTAAELAAEPSLHFSCVFNTHRTPVSELFIFRHNGTNHQRAETSRYIC